MKNNITQIHKDISNFFSDRLTKYGATPKGVDWKDEDSQVFRFLQLIDIIQEDEFELNELGCGYGKFFEVFENEYPQSTYKGYDISSKMIAAAREKYVDPRASFIHIENNEELEEGDYTVASGVFNLKWEYGHKEWAHYITDTLHKMDRASRKGFAFNMLTAYSDPGYMREDLYYASPGFFFDYCMQNFSRRVQLKHDYPLYEFTILVKKIET